MPDPVIEVYYREKMKILLSSEVVAAAASRCFRSVATVINLLRTKVKNSGIWKWQFGLGRRVVIFLWRT